MRPPSSELLLKRLHLSSDVEFADLLRLYGQAFPKTERKPTDVLRRMLASPGYHILLAREQSVTVGFTIVRSLTGGSAGLLEYMAVAPPHRRRGLGREIFLATATAIHAPPLTLLIEVESDREGTAVPALDRTLRARRKRFYRSLGARELRDLRWIMPPQSPAPPPPMEMLLFPAPLRPVSKDQLRQWLSGIYVEVYGQSPDDPRLDTMLAHLPPEVDLI